jgi:hypothetical protein
VTIPSGPLNGTLRVGVLNISQIVSITPQNTTTSSTASGFFLGETLSNFSGSSGTNQASIGNCVVYTFSSGSSSGTVATAPLDAGTAITLSGPVGSVTMNVLSIPGNTFSTFYAPPGGSLANSFIPASGGMFTFDNGPGGKDVQHFTAAVNLPGSFVWTNAAQIATVSRSQGVTVTWSGGASGAFVDISGSSSVVVGGNPVSASFVCEAPVSAGQFTVPVPVLLSLPTGNGSLSLGTSIGTQTFSAPGLDYGVLSGSMGTSKTLGYN